MMDQQLRYKNDHFLVVLIGEAQADHAVVDKVLNGKVHLLYISPENILENKKYRDMFFAQAYYDKPSCCGSR